MLPFDAPTVLLQWAAGGFAFLWVTTRHRLVGLGYGWLMRVVFASIGLLSLLLAVRGRWVPVRDLATVASVLAALVALGVSVARRGAGVSAQRDSQRAARRRVDAMVVAAVPGEEPASAAMQMRDQFGRLSGDADVEYDDGAEFPPLLDLLAPALAFVGVIGAAVEAAGRGVDDLGGGTAAPVLLAVARLVVGSLFLGAVTDAMLLGHWYLVQPGLSRRPIHELNDWVLRTWPVEVALLLIPTGMLQAVSGSVSDGWGGMLSWFWIACALTTGILGFVTRIALRERYYSAVMAATGFLYLAILMAFCTDLIARAILS